MMNKSKIKNKAHELSELCISNTDQFAAEYERMFKDGDYSETECNLVAELVDVYTAVKQGYMTRDEGAAEQKRILNSK